MAKFLQKNLTHLGVLTGHPIAFLILIAYVAGWWVFERHTLDFHGWATIFTWLMTLFIQRAEHRDTEALHAKLDELLRATGGARGDLAAIDEETAEDIEAHREASRQTPG
ncbi:low affinity iron permease family protein [Phenylobacterium sp.]|uniref:low affinity iron permease family protein n=1 Tax=Phenylobacterium sp. TaxID=1871053 RepID=UPI0035B44741